MGKWLATVLVLLCVLSMVPATGAGDPSYKIFFHKTYNGIVPVGVFRNYVIGYRFVDDVTEIVAVNMYNDSIRVLGLAESLGLDPGETVFWETGDYFMLVDGRTVVIWDGRLRQVGRHAEDELKGAVVLPNGYLVAWSRDVVLVSAPLFYVYGDLYDIWEIVYKYSGIPKIPPREFLELAGYSVDEIIADVVNDVLNTVREQNGTIVEGPNVSIVYDLEARTPSELREKIVVDIVAASLIADKLYVAVNVRLPVAVIGWAKYMVVENNATVLHDYRAVRVYDPVLGSLLEIDAQDNNLIDIKVFRYVEVGAVSSVMAFVYEPLLNESRVPRMLLILLEDGTKITVPVYTVSNVEEVYLAGNFELVKTGTGILIVYRRGIFVEAFTAEEINDIGVLDDGRVYIVYRNRASALELGFIDEYSGRYRKYVVETSMDIVGAHIIGDTVFLAGRGNEGTVVKIAAREPLASILVRFTDPYGNMITSILEGTVRVAYRNIVLESKFDMNPLVLVVPPGSQINISVHVPYGKGFFTYNISEPGSFEYTAPITLALTPGELEVTGASKTFHNPFFREYAVIKDSESMKYELPGALSMDAYGSLLAIAEAPGPNTTPSCTRVSVYKVDGVKLYSTCLPGTVTEVRFYYPYLVARSDDRVYVLDALTGTVKGTVGLRVVGYDVDAMESYVTVWSHSIVAVLDLRKQTVTYFNMSRYGVVMVAPVINGMVYVYVVSPGKTANVYVINPTTKGIVDILPWNGRKVLSFASDGRFHVISYETVEGRTATDILSLENGIVRLDDGPVLWVKSLGRTVNVPGSTELRGNEFAAVAVKDSGVVRVYVVGMNTRLVHEIRVGNGDVKLSLNYMAEVPDVSGAQPIIVLRDYSGAPRITVLASITPSIIAVSENLIAYGNTRVVYLLPNPKVIGKYHIVVRVYDDQGKPLDAKIYLREFGVETEARDGVFKVYLSVPGTYHIDVASEYFKEKELTVTISDENPVAELVVRMEPALFTLAVNITTPDGRPVRDGSLIIMGVDVDFETTINLSEQEPVVKVRKGTYDIVFTSDAYEEVEVTVEVTQDIEVALSTNRTGARLTVRVIDESDEPVAGASVVIESQVLDYPIELVTDEHGEVHVVLPYGVTGNITVSHPDYSPVKTSFNATEAVEEEPIILRLVKPRVVVTITLQDEEGNPESASVTVRDAMGNIVDVVQVAQTAMVELDPGTYVFEAVTEDGREASSTVTLSPDTPFASVNLVFPKKPTPLHITVFPYLLVAVTVASAAIIVYRRFFRKPKPRKVV